MKPEWVRWGCRGEDEGQDSEEEGSGDGQTLAVVRDLEACIAQVRCFQVMIKTRVRWSLGGAALEVRQEEVFQLGLWVLPGSSTFLKSPDTSRPGKNTCGEKGKSRSSDQAGPD